MVGRGEFREDRLDGFWRFVAERQRVWFRRVVLTAAPPWTDEEALRRYRFTNVYRALDPGTQYAIREILSRDARAADRLFNLLLYRLVGRAETHEALGFQRVEAFDSKEFGRGLRARRDAGEPVFTGAYLVSGYAGMGGSDKVENVARLFGEIRDRFDEFHARVEAATEPEEAYEAIRDLPGFGNFLSYQVFVDCTYPIPDGGTETPADGESLLPFTPDEWAAAGPGAKRGLDLLVADASDRADLDAMCWLRENQAEEFDRLSIDFEWLRDDRGERIELSLADVQNCCCEFYKWDKVRSGAGRARRRFRAGDRRSAAELRALYGEYPISIEIEDYRRSDVDRAA